MSIMILINKREGTVFPQLCSFLIRHWEAWGHVQEKDDFEIFAPFLYCSVPVK